MHFDIIVKNLLFQIAVCDRHTKTVFSYHILSFSIQKTLFNFPVQGVPKVPVNFEAIWLEHYHSKNMTWKRIYLRIFRSC